MSLLDEVLSRVEIRNPPFPVHLDSVRNGTVLRVSVEVHHRDTGEVCTPIHSFQVPDFAHGVIAPLGSESPRLLLNWVADRVRAVFLHEFHECLVFEGRRMFEPHPDAEADATSDASPRYDFQIGPTNPPLRR